jgi:hypothetical protein
MSASKEHNDLTALGAKWLKRQGFPVVATELNAAGSREQPDVVGFRSTCSAIIEVKVSRGDFLVDMKKPERLVNGSGLGLYRFYLCPVGLIAPAELPPKWGLLYVAKGKVVEVVKPHGNMWASAEHAAPGWVEFQHSPNLYAERSALFSIARRLAQGQPVMKHQSIQRKSV